MNRKILKKAFSFVFSLFLIISFVSCSKGDCDTDAVISTYTQATSREEEITTTLESDAIASTAKYTTEDITVIVPIETEITEIPIINIVTDDGKDGKFKGFNNNINSGINAPYKVCTVHNELSWNAGGHNTTPTVPSTGG